MIDFCNDQGSLHGSGDVTGNASGGVLGYTHCGSLAEL